ncbi:MAG: STAS domain-containing protein [Rhodomicrobium sp.]
MMTSDMKVMGRFDGAFAAGARPIFERLAKELRDVTVDMTEATDLDMAGLGALVCLHKSIEPHGCKVRVVGASGRLQVLFARFYVADLFIEGAAKPDTTALRNCFFGLKPMLSAIPAQSSEVRKPGPEVSKESGIRHLVPAKEGLDSAAARTIKAWLETSTIAGGELRGGDALKSYRRWAGKIAEAGDKAWFRANLAAIVGADRVIARNSGYVVKGIELRRLAARGKERQGSKVQAMFGLPARTVGMEAISAVRA